MEIRLEYNQNQGGFHFENPNRDNENTHGWVTICKLISVEDAYKFTNMIYKKYPLLDQWGRENRENKVSLKTVKSEFLTFVILTLKTK